MENITTKEIIQRFAEIQNISYEAANKLIGGDSEEEVLNNITNFTKQKMYSNLNRAQRRALQKQEKKQRKNKSQPSVEQITDIAQQLNYIDLIQKLRKLNEEKEKNGETTFEDD